MELRHLILLLLLTMAPMPGRSETASYQDAFGEYKAGNLEKALKEVDGLLAKEAGNAKDWELKGRILHGLGRYDEAVDDYFKALKIDPKRVECHYYLGEAAFAQGYWPEAIEFYKVHLAKAGQQPKTRLKLIYCQVATGNLSEAAKHVPFLDPRDDLFPGYYYGQTAMYLAEAKQEKDAKEAKAYEKKANDLLRQARTLYGNAVANTYEIEMLRIFKKSESPTLPPPAGETKPLPNAKK
jgi:tetratricopeptide (TPR) repeat protein